MEPDKYCMSCGTKYPWYEEECPDCHQPLRPLPDDQAPAPNAELVAILRTSERALLPLFRLSLEQRGIDVTIEDSGFSEQLFGRRSSATVGETRQPFSILVRSEDATRARQVLEDLQQPGTSTPAAPAASVTPTGPMAPTEADAIDLEDAKTGTHIGSLTEAQFEDLSTHLERESSDDDDYYIDGSTLDLLADKPVDASVVQMLRQALGSRSGMDVRWTRRADAPTS